MSLSRGHEYSSDEEEEEEGTNTDISTTTGTKNAYEAPVKEALTSVGMEGLRVVGEEDEKMNKEGEGAPSGSGEAARE